MLKTNRPPTDEEKTNINESAANNNAKLKAVEAQISETIAHIQALKLQVEQVELRLQEWLAGLALPVKRSVNVIEEPVPDVNGLAGGLGNRGPAVELLRYIAELVVIAVERIEGTK